ncbi:hypothetical protein AB0N42_20470 [Streptomyces pseudogriseolus]|uniref:hypothetical protein n=1 Tax=Streptomyces pseudogriseolus TaxID=36817 RepID=UPI00349A3172
MNPPLSLVEAAVAPVAEQASAQHPQPWQLVTGLLLGALLGIGAALLHSKDGASKPAAVLRGGTAFVGGASLSLVSLLTWTPQATLPLLLSAAVVCVVAGVLHRMNGQSIPESLWRAAVAFTGIAGFGQLIIGFYTISATAVALTAPQLLPLWT